MNRKIFFSAFFFISLSAASSQNIQSKININPSSLPKIEKLSRTDLIFRQFSQTVEYNSRLEAKSQEDEDFIEEYYTYKALPGDDLLNLHAATGIPYDTIATLNRISDNSEEICGKTLILPTIKGIYLNLKPSTAVEYLISEENSDFVENSLLRCYTLNNCRFLFLPGKRFSSTQRAFFLDSAMGLPLDSIRVTSEYGYRKSPVYGTWKFHKGVDFGASTGTKVYACKNGTVSLCVKNDPVFGNYIILSHADGITSVYAHLSKLLVTQGEIVKRGKTIGLSGESGAVTGPHLHFEVRQNGRATDPKFIYER